MIGLDPTSSEYERAVAARWGPRDPTIRSFWQSPVVQSELNRRITGDPRVTPVDYFGRKYCSPPRGQALSIGCGDGGIELQLLGAGACDRLVGIDLSAERLERARAAVPPSLTGRLELICANAETWRPDRRFDLIVTNGVVHHIEGLEAFFDLIEAALSDDGLLYLDEFVGPSRFQWTDKQIELVNRLLDRLSPGLRRDLVSPDAGPRPAFTRPSAAGLIASDPSEAARSAEIAELLHRRLEKVEEHQAGGAIYHQFFNRIMGNFAGHDDLVRVIVELDGILTEGGVVGSDYLWGVYRRRPEPGSPMTTRARADGRLESIEGGVVVGWAANPGDPQYRVPVQLHIDGRPAAQSVADLPRADLASEGFGDGAHAFRIELPGWARDGAEHSISVVAAPSGQTLPVARGWEGRNRSAPDGTRFTFRRTVEESPG